MARIRILTAHSLGGGRDVFPGDIIEVSDNEAEQKVSRGWAAYVSPDTSEYFVNRQEQIKQRDPKSVTHRDPNAAAPGALTSHGREPQGEQGRRRGNRPDDAADPRHPDAE